MPAMATRSFDPVIVVTGAMCVKLEVRQVMKFDPSENQLLRA
jgi:hypothetical protein